MKEKFESVQKRPEETVEEMVEKFRRAESEPLEITKTDVLIDSNVELKMAVTANRWPNVMGKDRHALVDIVVEQLTRKGWIDKTGNMAKPFGVLCDREFALMGSMPPFDLNNNDGTFTGIFHYILVEPGSRRQQEEELKSASQRPQFPPNSPGYNE